MSSAAPLTSAPPIFGIVPASRFWLDSVLQGFKWSASNTNAHSGIDFAMPLGTPVESPVNGVVTGSAVEPWGGQVDVQSDLPGYGVTTLSFLHLSNETVRVGQQVNAGDVIGLSGQPPPGGPYGSGPHLHFEMTHGSMAPYVTSYGPHHPTATSYPIDPSFFIGSLATGTQAAGQNPSGNFLGTGGSSTGGLLGYLSNLQTQWISNNAQLAANDPSKWPFPFPPPPPPPASMPDFLKQIYYSDYIKQEMLLQVKNSNPLCGVPLVGNNLCQLQALVQTITGWLGNPLRIVKMVMGFALVWIGINLLTKDISNRGTQAVRVVNPPPPPQEVTKAPAPSAVLPTNAPNTPQPDVQAAQQAAAGVGPTLKSPSLQQLQKGFPASQRRKVPAAPGKGKGKGKGPNVSAIKKSVSNALAENRPKPATASSVGSPMDALIPTQAAPKQLPPKDWTGVDQVLKQLRSGLKDIKGEPFIPE